MHRKQGSRGEVYSAARAAQAQQHAAAIRQVGIELDTAWKNLDDGWKDLHEHLVMIGVRSVTSEEDLLSLNVGGVSVVLRHGALKELKLMSELFEGVWDERLPRDKNGWMVLDESPACVKHLVYKAKTNPGDTGAIEHLPADEGPHLEYISYVLGVKNSFQEKRVVRRKASFKKVPAPRTALSAQVAEDARNFGVSMANYFMEERVELSKAQNELPIAEAKASCAVQALTAVYGPDIASGKEDEVVELSVRGTRVTTLRSTLTFYPDSVFATWFNGNWEPTDKDHDDQGWRIVDCSPSVFSKVLDVLRMRKRAGWALQESEGKGGGVGVVAPIPVIVREVDQACFSEFVDKYFPGRESFIMDLVAPGSLFGGMGEQVTLNDFTSNY